MMSRLLQLVIVLAFLLGSVKGKPMRLFSSLIKRSFVEATGKRRGTDSITDVYTLACGIGASLSSCLNRMATRFARK